MMYEDRYCGPRGDTGPGGRARADGAHCTGRPVPTPLLFNTFAAEFVGNLYNRWTMDIYTACSNQR